MTCIDTNTLIYGTTANPAPDKVDLCRDARNAVTRLAAAEGKPSIPSMCVAEYLAGPAVIDKTAALAWIKEQFNVLNFDENCWLKASAILAAKDQLKEAQTVQGATRQSIRVDSFILAIISGHGATLVTNDEGLTKLAKAMGVGVMTPAEYLASVAP